MAMAVTAAAPIPAVSSHQMLVFLLQIGVLLSCAVLLGQAAARLRLPPVVGELTAGVVLGPSLFGRLLPGASGWLLPKQAAQAHLLSAVAQLGVLLLVGIAGAHIDLGALRRRSGLIGTVSAGSVLLPLAAGFGLGLLLPASLLGPSASRTAFALFIAVAVAISALPVIAKTLVDMGLLHRDVGQLIIGAAAVSDIFGWLLLSIVSAMATKGLHAGVVVRSVGYLLIVLAFTVLCARPIVRRILGSAARTGRPPVGTAAAVVVIVLAAAGTQALGLEPILGAFLCGMVIGSLGAQGRAPVQSMYDFTMATLAPLFFASAGLQVDLTTLGRPAILAAAAATLLVAVAAKFAGGYAGARIGGVGHREAQAVGAGLNARGAVEIVLATVGLNLKVLTIASFTIIVLVAVVTSMMAPPLLRRATRAIEPTAAETTREREFAGTAV
jgi:Kef-type K+ transport system membrane component KefB